MFFAHSLPEIDAYILHIFEKEGDENVVEFEISKELFEAIESNPDNDVRIESGQPIVYISEEKKLERERGAKIQDLIRLDRILDEYSLKLDKYRKMDDSPVKATLVSSLEAEAAVYETQAMQLLGQLIKVYKVSSTEIAKIIGGTIGNHTI